MSVGKVVLTAPAISSEPVDTTLKLSATRIKMYRTCPRQYRYKYVDKVPTILTGALAFGQTIRQALHDMHQSSIYSGKPLNSSIAFENFARLWKQAVEEQEPVFKSAEEVAEYLKLAELILMGYVETQRGKRSPLVMEFPFEIEVRDEQTHQNYVLCGVIDRIDQEEEGLVIVDYKTGKRKPSARDLAFDLQLTIYAYAARATFGQEILEVQLHHLRDQTIFHNRRGPADGRTLLNVMIPHVLKGI